MGLELCRVNEKDLTFIIDKCRADAKSEPGSRSTGYSVSCTESRCLYRYSADHDTLQWILNG